MPRKKREGSNGIGDAGPTTPPPPPPQSPFAPLQPLPAHGESNTETAVSFWEKVKQYQRATGNSGTSATVSGEQPASNPPGAAAGGPPPPPPQAGSRQPNVPARPTPGWEEAGQYAFNASIMRGSFEDLRIVAFSRRIAPDRIGVPRMLYANSTLVTRMLPDIFQDDAVDELTDRLEELELYEDVPESAASYGYGEDSDLEDVPLCEEEDDEKDKPENIPRDRDKGEANNVVAHEQTSGPYVTDHAKSSGEAGSAPTTSERASPAEDEDFISVAGTLSSEPKPKTQGPAQAEQDGTPTARPQAPAEPPAARDGACRRTIVVRDSAFRTWRALVFYAYTGRIAFAPLRSQGLGTVQADDESEAAQLPICSPKSAYRLAMKYGLVELQDLAARDISFKLSTQNALAELFSPFAARYPIVRCAALDFVYMHIRHHDIAVALPVWVDHFARGELKHCSDVFSELIQKLSGAVPIGYGAPSGTATQCPKGCAFARVDHRCSMCGYTFC
ncbi:hypothetical protein C8Q77DRAFT_1057543 [Trametes polyzona]|nr:hypothetical protein C8Q77DRAFT_1057543 [Trametes polyzona]